jgi:hypothetical protein
MNFNKDIKAKLLAKRKQPKTTVKEIENPSIFRPLWGLIKNQYSNDLERAKDISIDYVTKRKVYAKFRHNTYLDIIDTIERTVTVSSLLLYFTILIKKYEHMK